MTITIHPLRFARRPCLRGTVSYCWLMLDKDGTTHVMPSLFFVCTSEEGGVYSSTVLQFVFVSFILTPQSYILEQMTKRRLR